MRRTWLVILALVMPWSLSGCSVPPDGIVGIGRVADGTLWVFVRTCHHPMDGATLYWPDDPNGDDSNNEVFGEWKIGKQPDPLRASWPILGPGGNGVDATVPLSEVPASPKTMTIYAWTRDNSYSAYGPSSFTKSALKKLKPGQVLSGDAPKNKSVSLAAFDALDCADFEYE